MKSKKGLIIVIASLIFIVLLPLAIDWLIIGNEFPSNIGNSDWVGFFGGYIGAIIGAVVSLIGIIITIRYTNEQNKRDRELQVRPYCSIRYVYDDKLVGTKKILGTLPIGCEPQSNNGPRYDSIIYIKNVGLGPAIEFDFEIDEIDDGREHYPILMQRTPETMNNAVRLLQPGEEAALPILIYFNFDPVSPKDVIKDENLPIFAYSVKHSVMTKYKNFEIVITVKYSDMFENEFSQKIVLSSNMHMKITEDGKASHLCDIYLKETTLPIKTKARNF
ncbi:MAG: hypothetical protein IJC02_14280 [Lachnospiraceae bacterium]|nr:hypothetical protein [Lachnospiraceae bacterium]